MRKFLALLFVLLFVLSSASAFADDTRKVDFLVVLKDPDGDALTECVKPDDKGECVGGPRRSITLGMVSMRALIVPERDITPEQSLIRGQLALSVYKSPGISLSAEEIVLIKKQIAKAFSPAIVVRAFPLLDPSVK